MSSVPGRMAHPSAASQLQQSELCECTTVHECRMLAFPVDSVCILHLQGSLYEAYQQRETETKPDSKDYRNRFATLTSDWVNRPAIPGLQDMQLGSRTATSFSAARDASDGQEAPPARDPKGTGMEAEAPRRESADEEESEALRKGAQGNVSRSGPLAGVLSRSVGLVTSLAQSMRGLRSRRGGGDCAHSRNCLLYTSPSPRD